MAKRTRDSKFAARDISISIERRFLASTQDAKDLRYEYEQSASHPETSGEYDAPVVAESATVERATKPPLLNAQAAAVRIASIADVPTSAYQIVQALVAHKFKKEIEQVVPSRSIKELCGGESEIRSERCYQNPTDQIRKRQIHITK